LVPPVVVDDAEGAALLVTVELLVVDWARLGWEWQISSSDAVETKPRNNRWPRGNVTLLGQDIRTEKT
jgi:hypothetical protein